MDLSPGNLGLEYQQSEFVSCALFIDSPLNRKKLDQKCVFEVPWIILLLLNLNHPKKQEILTNCICKFLEYPPQYHHTDPQIIEIEDFYSSNIDYSLTWSEQKDFSRRVETQLPNNMSLNHPVYSRGTELSRHMQILLSYALKMQNLPLVAYLIQPEENREEFDENGRKTENQWKKQLDLAKQMCDHVFSEDQLEFDTSLLLCPDLVHPQLFKLLLTSHNHMRVMKEGHVNEPTRQFGAWPVNLIGKFAQNSEFVTIKMPYWQCIIKHHHYQLLKIWVDQRAVGSDEITAFIQKSESYGKDLNADLNQIISQCALFDDIIALKFMFHYYTDDQRLRTLRFERETIKNLFKSKSFQLLSFLTEKCPDLALNLSKMDPKDMLTAISILPDSSFPETLDRQAKTCTNFISFILTYPHFRIFLSTPLSWSSNRRTSSGVFPRPKLWKNYLDYCIQHQIPHVEGLYEAGIRLDHESDYVEKISPVEVEGMIIQLISSPPETDLGCEAFRQTLQFFSKTLALPPLPFLTCRSPLQPSEEESSPLLPLSLISFHTTIQLLLPSLTIILDRTGIISQSLVVLPRWVAVILLSCKGNSNSARNSNNLVKLLFDPTIEPIYGGKINLLSRIFFTPPLNNYHRDPELTVDDNLRDENNDEKFYDVNHTTLLHLLTLMSDKLFPVLETIINKYIGDILDPNIDFDQVHFTKTIFGFIIPQN